MCAISLVTAALRKEVSEDDNEMSIEYGAGDRNEGVGRLCSC